MKNFALLAARVLLSILVVATGLAEKAAGADWPNFRGPNHNGISSERLLLGQAPKVKHLWGKNIGVGCSSVVVVGGRVYTMSNAGKTGDEKSHEDVVYCFDANTGNEIWSYRYKCGLNFKFNTPGGAGQLHKYTCLIVRNHLDLLDMCEFRIACQVSNRPGNINCR